MRRELIIIMNKWFQNFAVNGAITLEQSIFSYIIQLISVFQGSLHTKQNKSRNIANAWLHYTNIMGKLVSAITNNFKEWIKILYHQILVLTQSACPCINNPQVFQNTPRTVLYTLFLLSGCILIFHALSRLSFKRYSSEYRYRMVGNFCGVLIFVIFVVDLAVTKFSHPRKLMPTSPWWWAWPQTSWQHGNTFQY